MDYHVLALTLSTLRDPILSNKADRTDKVDRNAYQFTDADGSAEKIFYGIGQMESIPQFIESYYDTKITHVIILETPETKAPCGYDWPKLRKLCQEKEYTLADQNDLNEKTSALSFFTGQMAAYGITPKYIHIDVDKDDPESGLDKLLQTIRDLYKDCEEQGGDWKLWLDAHGGFRDLSLAMFALMQVLSATDMRGCPKLTDAQKLIPITAVYTIQFQDGQKNHDQPHRIVDKTRFYRKFTGDTFKAYMNYGQYLQTMISPYEGDEPYAFISYKHKEAEKERIALFGILKAANVRYWYDDGIPIHENWEETLKDRNENCSVFIALLTDGYLNEVRGFECVKELKRAIDAGKPILFINLQESNQQQLYLDHGVSVSKGNETIVITAEEMQNQGIWQQIDLCSFYKNDALQEELIRKIRGIDCLKCTRFES